MSRSTVSVCHGLKIIPLLRILQFIRLRSKIVMMLLGDPADIKEIPGTIRITTTEEEGWIRKKITFERSDVSATTAELLERYKASFLVAAYTDESGQRRISGSPECPLTLDYTIESGAFSVTLEGKDTKPDGFLDD